MRDGKVVGRVQTRETNAAELARLMVGREVLLRVEKPVAQIGETKLQVTDPFSLGQRHASVDKVHSQCAPARSLVLPGVEGNGQTELIEALAGLVASAQLSGRIFFEGKEITHQAPALIARRHCPHPRGPASARVACWSSVLPTIRFWVFTTGRPLPLMPAISFSDNTASNAGPIR